MPIKIGKQIYIGADITLTLYHFRKIMAHLVLDYALGLQVHFETHIFEYE